MFIMHFEQMHESSVSLKVISTSETFKSLQVITYFYGCYEVPNDNAQRQLVYLIVGICHNTLKNLLKSVFVKKTRLKFSTVASTKDSY